MKNQRALKIFFLSVLLGYASFAYTLPALAQTPAATPTAPAKPEYTGVQGSIKDFLCTPTEQPKSQGTGDAGYSGSASNNPASSDLFNCINKLYRFAIVVASVVGMFYVVAAGYLYMSADGSSESTGEAKQYIGNVVAAFIILFAGNIILKAINPNLVNFYSVNPNVSFAKIAEGLSGSTGTSYPNGGGPGTPVGPAGQCKLSNTNFCQSSPGWQCATCSQYDSAIKAAASKHSIPGVNMEALLKAIMSKESSCIPGRSSLAGAQGLMQFMPATANSGGLKGACGVTANIDAEWLKSTANTDSIMCMAAAYLKSNSQGACGTDVRNVIASYNGGSGVCSPSTTCQGESSCTGGGKRVWECLYNGPTGARTTCNTGYDETREYVSKVLTCYQQFGGSAPSGNAVPSGGGTAGGTKTLTSCSGDLTGGNILIIGDSLATGPGIGQKLIDKAKAKGANAKTIAVTGSTISQWAAGGNQAAALQAEIASFKPSIVFISLGTNDANNGVSVSTANQKAASLISSLGSAKVFWMGPPKSQTIPDAKVIAVSTGIASTAGGQFFNTYTQLPTITSGSTDGIHPTPAGYANMANSAWNFCGGS